MGRKSQITLFIILGIVIVGFIIIMLSTQEKVEIKKTEKILKKTLLSDYELQPVKTYIESCLRKSTDDVIFNKSLMKEIYGLSEKKVEYDGVEYPVLYESTCSPAGCTDGYFYNKPMNAVEANLTEKIAAEFEKCLDLSFFENVYNISGPSIDYKSLNVTVKINDIDIGAENISVVLTKKDSEGVLDSFNVEVPIRLGLIYNNITNDLLKNISTYKFYTTDEKDYYNLIECKNFVKGCCNPNPTTISKIKFIETVPDYEGIVIIEDNRTRQYSSFNLTFGLLNVNITSMCECIGEETCPTILCEDEIDDERCGIIDCSVWYVQTGTESATTTEYCYNKQDITTNRCEGVEDCKDPNTADCDVQSNDQQLLECGVCKYIDSSSCTGTTLGSCTNYDSGTSCGSGLVCDGSGNCISPLCSDGAGTDDPDCGIIDCDGLNYYYTSGTASVEGTNYCILRDYDDITTDRCEGLSDCKDANTADCTSYSDPTAATCGQCKYATGACSSCTNYPIYTSCLGAYYCCDGTGLCTQPKWNMYKSCTNGPGLADSNPLNCVAGWNYDSSIFYEVKYCYSAANCGGSMAETWGPWPCQAGYQASYSGHWHCYVSACA